MLRDYDEGIKMSQSKGRDTQEVAGSKGHMRFLFTYLLSYIQPLSLISELTFSCCSPKVTGALGQFWYTGIKYHKSPTEIHRE